MRGDNKPLSVAEINSINNVLKQLNAKTIPYNTKAHNAAKKLDQAYLKAHAEYESNEFHAKNKKKRQTKASAQALTQALAKAKTNLKSAGGGGASESKQSESNYFNENSEEDEEDESYVKREKHRTENRAKRIGTTKAVKALTKFATKKQTDRYNETTGKLHSDTKEAERVLSAFANNRDRPRNPNSKKEKAKKLLNISPTMVDPNLMEEQKQKAQDGLKTMASTLKKKDMLKDLKRVADYKEKQNEEASKKRQAIMAEGQTDLTIRQPTPHTGIGKMADADSTVKPKGQVLVEEFIELKDTDPIKAEVKRKQLQDEFNEEDINTIVNKTPGKTGKEKKAIKALIRSNDPIELPALPLPHICQVNHHQEHQKREKVI
jgi:hypothetical protein